MKAIKPSAMMPAIMDRTYTTAGTIAETDGDDEFVPLNQADMTYQDLPQYNLWEGGGDEANLNIVAANVIGAICAGESFYWLHELFADAGPDYIPFICNILGYIGNDLVESPDELCISSGVDGYYPALRASTRRCKYCNKEGCNSLVCLKLRRDVKSTLEGRGPLNMSARPRPRTASMPGRRQLTKVVKSGGRARTRFTKDRNAGNRLTYSSARGGRPAPLRKRSSFVDQVTNRAAALIAPIQRDIEEELRVAPYTEEAVALSAVCLSQLNAHVLREGIDYVPEPLAITDKP